MRAKRTFDGLAVQRLRTCPALRRAQDNHRPLWTLYVRRSRRASLLLDAPDFLMGLVERGCHQRMHRVRILTLDEIWLVAISEKELLQFSAIHAGQHRWTGDLVSVEVQYR